MSPAPPPDDDDDRLLEALDAGEPPRSPEEAQARIPYQRLIERARDLSEIEPPPGWEARAAARWSARPTATRRRRRWSRAAIALALSAAAAAAAVLLLRPCSSPSPSPSPDEPLEVAVVPPAGVSRRGEGTGGFVGDTLHARARRKAAHVELRIYRDTKVVARCPGDQRCRPDAADPEIDLVLTKPGRYQPVLLLSPTPIPAPGDDMAPDIHRASAAGAEPIYGEVILVRR